MVGLLQCEKPNVMINNAMQMICEDILFIFDGKDSHNF